MTSGVVMGLRFSTVGSRIIPSRRRRRRRGRCLRARRRCRGAGRERPRGDRRRRRPRETKRRLFHDGHGVAGETEAAGAEAGAPLPLGSPPREHERECFRFAVREEDARCAVRAEFEEGARFDVAGDAGVMARWPSRLCTRAGARVASTSAVASASIWSSAVASTMVRGDAAEGAVGVGGGDGGGARGGDEGRRATAGIPPAHAAGTGRCAAARETANAEEDAWRADRRAAAERSDAGLIAEAAGDHVGD